MVTPQAVHISGALNENGGRLYLLRFGLYGLLFFTASAYLALGPYPPEDGALKYAAAFGVIGGASSMHYHLCFTVGMGYFV